VGIPPVGQSYTFLADAYGVGAGPAGGTAMPAAAQRGDGQWFRGYQENGGLFYGVDSNNSTVSFAAPVVAYLANGGTCPAPSLKTDPAKALQFQGSPSCMDMTKKGIVTGYDGTSCITYSSAYSPKLFGL